MAERTALYLRYSVSMTRGMCFSTVETVFENLQLVYKWHALPMG